MDNIHIDELNSIKVKIYSNRITIVQAYQEILNILARCSVQVKDKSYCLFDNYFIKDDNLYRFSGVNQSEVRVKNKSLLKNIEIIESYIQGK